MTLLATFAYIFRSLHAGAPDCGRTGLESSHTNAIHEQAMH